MDTGTHHGNEHGWDRAERALATVQPEFPEERRRMHRASLMARIGREQAQNHTAPVRTFRPLRPVFAVPTAVAAAGALVAGTLLWPAGEQSGIPSAYAAPPPTPEVSGGTPVEGSEQLLALADLSEERGAAPGDGDVAHVSATGMNLQSATAEADPEEGLDEDRSGYGFVPSDWQRWEDPEGNMRRSDQVRPPEEGDQDGYEWFMEEHSDTFDETLPAEELVPDELPTEPAQMAETLVGLADPWSTQSRTEALVKGTSTLYDRHPLSGAEEATVQRALAEELDVEYLGASTDPLGREGEMFQVEDDQESFLFEQRFLFDAEDGSLLYTDSVMLEDRDGGFSEYEDRGLELPVVSSQATYVWSGWVDEVGGQP